MGSEQQPKYHSKYHFKHLTLILKNLAKLSHRENDLAISGAHQLHCLFWDRCCILYGLLNSHSNTIESSLLCFCVNKNLFPYAMSLIFFTLLGPLGKGCSSFGAADVDSGQTNVHLFSKTNIERISLLLHFKLYRLSGLRSLCTNL